MQKSHSNEKIKKVNSQEQEPQLQIPAPVFNISNIMEIPGPKRPKNAYMHFATEQLKVQSKGANERQADLLK